MKWALLALGLACGGLSCVRERRSFSPADVVGDYILNSDPSVRLALRADGTYLLCRVAGSRVDVSEQHAWIMYPKSLYWVNLDGFPPACGPTPSKPCSEALVPDEENGTIVLVEQPESPRRYYVKQPPGRPVCGGP